jgi:hypothetical protein
VWTPDIVFDTLVHGSTDRRAIVISYPDILILSNPEYDHYDRSDRFGG